MSTECLPHSKYWKNNESTKSKLPAFTEPRVGVGNNF